MDKSRLSHRFSLLTRWSAEAAGSWQAFILALAIVIAWVLGGFYFGFSSEIYQLFINSLTTVWTFLMVFLIQGAQNRDSKALQAKLDALICAMKEADNRFIDLEHDTDEKIEAARQELVGRKTEDA